MTSGNGASVKDVYEIVARLEASFDSRMNRWESKYDESIRRVHEKIERVEGRTSVLEKFNDKVLGGMIAISFIVGTVVTLAKQAIERWINSN